ncbi:hypothetical protein [Methylocapsa sp. S129]|uniref:hypothetical protein n=1 Tax=Methylocapsa sp. S129 TaxID=1641869 RepID=UPI00131B5D5E|nr:hypothetical protein [Methylocapsa sp. S129]
MLITRRELLARLPLLAIAGATGAPAAEEKADFGAIRWDAWYRKEGDSVFPQQNLAPERYRNRAPINCAYSDADGMTCNGAQAVLDAEIEAAARAGLSFWAFDWYAANSSLRKAWDLYQSSALRNQIAWCPIIGLGDLSPPLSSTSASERENKLRAWCNLMQQPNYFKARMGSARRPLLFIFYRENELKTYFGVLDGLRAALDNFRRLCADEGVGNPYIVLFDPAVDVKLFTGSGADAISNYIAGFKSTGNRKYSELDRQVRAYWARMAAPGYPCVPILQVGWDDRPRLDHPVPWEQGDAKPAAKSDSYFEMASPEEFAAEVKAADLFMRDHPTQCPARVALIYSWSECDEGGCIMPTLGDQDGKYLRALAQTIR